MAHFAEIDSNNVVLRVLTVSDDQQHRGNDFLSLDLGLGGKWIQTSYNGNIRGSYAGVGYVYYEELDIFLPPQPYPSWTVDKEYGVWVAPVKRPDDITGKSIGWDEEKKEWKIEDLPIVNL